MSRELKNVINFLSENKFLDISSEYECNGIGGFSISCLDKGLYFGLDI